MEISELSEALLKDLKDVVLEVFDCEDGRVAITIDHQLEGTNHWTHGKIILNECYTIEEGLYQYILKEARYIMAGEKSLVIF